LSKGLKRPGLDQLLSHARRSRFDVVVVWAFDRLARSVRHFLEVLDEPLEASNHQLELAAIKLENANAKLQGKPQNHLAEALAEAAVKADELSRKLIKATGDAITLFKAEDRGWFSRTLHNSGGNGQAKQLAEEFSDQLEQIQHDEHYTANTQRLPLDAVGTVYLLTYSPGIARRQPTLLRGP